MRKLRMKEKMNILQFTPYFPPHKWWVETVAEEIADYWTKKWYWEVINITFDVGQENNVNYIQKWYKVFLLPSFDIIPNFPVPKFWKKEFWGVLKELKNYIRDNNTSHLVPPFPGEGSKVVVFSHTRFFLSSFIAGIFARRNKLKWIHIEHGSDYVQLSSKLKSKISYIYDKIIWKWIFKKADKALAISEACKKFIVEGFIDREVEVFYRWMNFENIPNNIEKKGEIQFVFIGRLVQLKWVSDLISAYKQWNYSQKLIIIWDGDEKENLKNMSHWYNIEFIWFQNKEFIYNYLQENNCICINPSYQEWMPTTVLEALMNSCPVIATHVWWTSEICNNADLQLIKSGNIDELSEKMNYVLHNYNNLKWKSFEEINEKFNREKNIEILFDKVK